MKIIVTGGAGFIGGNFVHYMLDRHPEDEIICVDCLTYAGNMETLASVMDNPKFQFEKLDITDREGTYGLFEREHPDIVVNFAAESHVDRSIKNPEVFVKTNVLGTLVMLNAAKAAWELPDGSFKEDKKFLHVSTDEVYGSLEEDGGYFYETTPYDPHSPYSANRFWFDVKFSLSGGMISPVYTFLETLYSMLFFTFSSALANSSSLIPLSSDARRRIFRS